MAISGKQTILVGAENQASGSDNIFQAFTKTENNFANLFACASPYTNFVAGNGITTQSTSSNGTVSITNTGILNVLAGTGVTVSTANGNVTISASGDGLVGVTEVGITSGTLTVSESPIISAGTIRVELPPITQGLTFTPGDYIAPTLTVDAYGRITSISNTASVGTVTSVAMQADGEGIAVTGSPVTGSGTISITNTGVTRLTAGAGIELSGSTGQITIESSLKASGTVTRVDMTSNTLTVLNSPITQSGTITIEIPDDITLVGNLVAAKITSNTTANIIGNVIGGNLTTAGIVSATGNVVGGNLTTAGQVDATGNVTGGNLVTTRVVQGSTVTTSGSKSASAWGTSGIGFIATGATYTDSSTAASGTVANAHIHSIARPTIAAANFTVTVSKAASFYVSGAPIAGGNITITNPYAIQVAAGNVQLDTSTTSSNTTTGALRVVGGVGIGENLNVGGNLSVTGNISVDKVSANLVTQSVGTSIAGAGVTQGDGTVLTKQLNIVSLANAGANAVVLPTPGIGASIKVVNTTANDLKVFPAVNGIINALGANAEFVMASNTRVEFCAASTTQWYTF
jgi:hypothetical protein